MKIIKKYIKEIIILAFSLLVFTNANATDVNIPDSNFKNKLLTANNLNLIARDINSNWITVDVNGDGEIQESEAENVAYLYITEASIASLDGIDKFTNLVYLDCSYNNLTSLDFSSNLSLEILYISNNSINNLNISSNNILTELYCSNNILNTLDVNSNVDLKKLYCNFNNLSVLNLNLNVDLTNLDCSNNNISSLNLETNIALTNLSCGNNSNLNVLDVNDLVNLISLDCRSNNMNNLNLSNNIELRYLVCNSNNLSSLDVSTNTLLINADCDNNVLLELDLSSNSSLTQLKCGNNPNLNYINLKNGNNHNFVYGTFSDFENLANLETICVDEIDSSLATFIDLETTQSLVFTEYCSLTSGLKNEINGNAKIDFALDGCDSSDLSVPNKMIISNNGTESFATFTQNNGNYLIYTNEGDFTTEILNIASYNTINPNLHNNTFTGFDNVFIADFCLAPNATENDVNISIIPVSQARTNFISQYKIVYNNAGNTVLNGSIIFNFNDLKMNFNSANPSENTISENTLTFNYSNLQPYETRIIDLEFDILGDPEVSIGDTLNFSAIINPITDDFTTLDNTFSFDQTVVSSYDPNDIHILEGTQIYISEKDQFLHYVIRFQNTGTADAINVVVKNVLDDKLDWSTLELQSTSHQNRVAITNGNKVEFIFENIHLADSTTDEENSHGYIAYKIKPKLDISVNEIIPSKADIFFDLNAAIETNIASTKFVNTLNIDNNNLANFNIYPIPVKEMLNVSSYLDIKSIHIYNNLGQLIIYNVDKNNINLTTLNSGIYFCKIIDTNGNIGIQKVIKK